MHLKTLTLGTALFLLAGGAVAAAPGDQIGSAITVVNLVTAELDRDRRSLKTGDNVRQEESIEVANDGSGELKFNDETKVALGPGSRLLLDTFVYDPEKKSGSIVLNAVKGTFRFITGVAAKPSYVIRIPNASITVRGSIWDLFVHAGGAAWLLLHEGSVQVCNDRGRCRILDQLGKLIRVTEQGEVGVPVKWAGLPDKENVPFDTAFPFVVKAPSFDPNPILTRDVIILGNLPESGNTHETEPDKPRKKTATKKSTRTAKKRSPDNDSGMSGMDIVIGVGVGGIGRRGGHSGHKPSSDMPKGHKY
ncbi:MAG TPA: FecR domain-containing protein [Hyphomicrobiaceae bacterium]|nr:FecR domain-containing protein [Hyphomicrobiaceae bacterium]